ncbi:MAG: hypothetical protein ACM3QX_18325 [Syntrophomonadaceae bacterium]
MNAPRIRTDSNFTRLELNSLTLFYSYETIIGFHTPETGMVISENVWSQTTGKHLNRLGDKKDRIPYDEFQEKLDQVLHVETL